jgi:hypothetical protein
MIGYCKRTGQRWGIPPGYHHHQIYTYFKHLPIYRGNIRKLPVYDTATDKGFAYEPIPPFPAGVKLRGFWQSYKYFNHVRAEVLDAWRFKNYPEFKGAVSIHVRRGDYVKHADYFPPVTVDYIKLAAAEVMNRTGKPPEYWAVFSDDIQWCKDHLNLPGTVKFIEGGTEYSDLSMMSSCDHNIIANSSFSWVAAYANTNPEKIVVSPNQFKNWFGPKNRHLLDTKDLLPPEWIQIEF